MNRSGRRLGRLVVSLSVVVMLLSGCGAAISSRELVLSYEGKYNDQITALESEYGRLSISERHHLCEAYLQVRNYEKLFSCISAYEQAIEADGSDPSLFMGTGKLRAMPSMMSAQANLETGNVDKAISDAHTAYKKANYHGKGYDTNRFASLAILVSAYSEKKDSDNATKYMTMLEDEPITFVGWGVQADAKRQSKARAYASMKMYDKLMDMSEDSVAGFIGLIALTTGDVGMNARREIPVNFMRAKALFEIGQRDKAIPVYRGLLADPSVRDFGDVYWNILNDMSLVDKENGRIEEAYHNLSDAILIIERQRSSISSEISRIGFVGDKYKVYENIVSLLVDASRFNDAFEYVERGKARALVDMLASKKNFWLLDAANGIGLKAAC